MTYDYTYNGKSCSSVLATSSLVKCLFEEVTGTPSAACTSLIQLDDDLHVKLYTKALLNANIIAGTDDAHSEPTDWVPLCYKFRDNSQCAFITNYDTDMTAVCVTGYATFGTSAMCKR